MLEITNAWYRVSVKGLIFNNNGEILLCKENNGMRDIPGGGLDRGENAHECIKREIREELGINVTSVSINPYCFAAVKNPYDKNRPWIANVCYEITVENLNFKKSDECVEIQFFNNETIKTINVFENVKSIMSTINDIQSIK